VSDRSLDARVALVTGAGRGIGRAIAVGLAAAGASVVVVSRTQAELESVRTEIEANGYPAQAFVTDVADEHAVLNLLQAVHASFGPIDILINNAAVVWPIGASKSIDVASWASALDVNLTSVARLSFLCLPDMLERRFGRIVNISSGVAERPGGMVGANAYVTSKAALEAHTLNLAAELAGTGVTVNAYRPGGVDTAMQAWIRGQPAEIVGQGLHDRFVATKESGSLLSPEQSAAGLLARIADAATGQIWNVADQV
jgi:3-oxoacyl-[acyl-carrier protein] reductase